MVFKKDLIKFKKIIIIIKIKKIKNTHNSQRH